MKPKNVPKKTIPIKYTLFIQSFKLAKSNPSKVGLMILFDILFLVSASILNILQTVLAVYLRNSFVKDLTYGLIVAIWVLLSLSYMLLMIFVYAFFKYSVLDFIKSLFQDTTFSFNRLGKFYILNMILLLPTFIAFNFVLNSVQLQYQPIVFLALGIPLSLLLYLIVNFSHSSYYEGNSIRDSIKTGFKITFTKLKSYMEIILVMILFALLLWLVFFASGYLIRLLSYLSYNAYITAYAYYSKATIYIFYLVFYYTILINRISFYTIVREKTKNSENIKN